MGSGQFPADGDSGPPELFLDAAAVAKILTDEFGLLAEAIQPLGGELATVCRVDTKSRQLAFKAVTPQAVDPELFRWQGEVQNMLAHRGLPVAELCELPTSGGLTACLKVAGQPVLVQVSQWLSGEPLSQVLPADVALRELGLVAAQVSEVLSTAPPAPLEASHPWELSRTRASIHAALSAIQDRSLRRVVQAAADRFADEVEPLFTELPRQAVHHDLHDDNVLLSRRPTGGWRVSGVLDFGDMVSGFRIADLVIPAAYASRAYSQPDVAIAAVARAWAERMPLTAAELRALLPAAIGRLAVNAAIWASRLTSSRAAYALERSAGSAATLERLLPISTAEFVGRLR